MSNMFSDLAYWDDAGHEYTRIDPPPCGCDMSYALIINGKAHCTNTRCPQCHPALKPGTDYVEIVPVHDTYYWAERVMESGKFFVVRCVLLGDGIEQYYQCGREEPLAPSDIWLGPPIMPPHKTE